MKVELLSDKTTEQITELWKAYQDYGMDFFCSFCGLELNSSFRKLASIIQTHECN